MARAIRLARLGLYTTDPNPRVGCVLVRDGEIVGEGWHRRAGEPHAERIALAAAGERARGATAYVTLEPCCHQGRTPPLHRGPGGGGCRRVVAAMVDPNPLVSGQGLARLRESGVRREAGLLEQEAAALNSGFVKRMVQGLPYCRCKLAASLDGRTSMATGESQWISSEASRRDVHRLRARSSAIITGVGTLSADDPSMTVRLAAADLPGLEPGEPIRQPLRVVVDSHLRTPASARMLALPGGTLIACLAGANPAGVEALRAAGARLQAFPEDRGRVHLEALLRWLAEQEINEVLLEAGPTLAGAALTGGLIDELVLYIAPTSWATRPAVSSSSRVSPAWSTASPSQSTRCAASARISACACAQPGSDRPIFLLATRHSTHVHRNHPIRRPDPPPGAPRGGRAPGIATGKLPMADVAWGTASPSMGSASPPWPWAPDAFSADVSRETLSLTTLGDLVPGARSTWRRP
jgi:diaminohydroxyphosphoribosylaminopyrimidine deaminase / 5-amino-6-(5-phosphoribosylamino)uracil reductase